MTFTFDLSGKIKPFKLEFYTEKRTHTHMLPKLKFQMALLLIKENNSLQIVLKFIHKYRIYVPDISGQMDTHTPK